MAGADRKFEDIELAYFCREAAIKKLAIPPWHPQEIELNKTLIKDWLAAAERLDPVS